MDRKSIIILAACFVLLMSWPFLTQKLYPPKPRPPGTTNTPAATATATTPSSSAVATNLESPAAAATLPAPSFTVPGAPEELLEVTNENAHYTFTSHGGGLKLVELLNFPESVASQRQKAAGTTNVATLNTLAPLPVLAVLGGEPLQGDGIFKLTRMAAGVRAEKTLTNGLTLVKEFQVSTNYLVAATVRLQNTAAQPLALPAQEWVIGTATPMGPDDNGQAVGLQWYDGVRPQDVMQAWFDNRTLGCFPGQPRQVYEGGASNVVWAAMHNQFFALAAMPKEPALRVVSRPVELPRPDSWLGLARQRNAPPPKGYQTAFAYPAVTLAAGEAIERQFFFFAGPKEYRTLAHIGDRFNNNLDVVMGFSGFFGFFAKALLLAMNWLHDLLRLGYGWVIILITILIKLVFWPLTQVSTRSMKRMQALQPQMNALKEKYKDDPAKMNKKLMEFMKENKVSPMGGCLPMVIQLPIFFGFYRMIQSAIELRGEHWLWISDLSKPDTLFHVPIPGFAELPFNLLPLLMGVTMLWQARLTPPSPGMDPTQQKIMKYMPLMFLFILYNFSAGLTLYWTVQNLLTIAQMKLTKTRNTPVGAVTAPAPAPRKKK